MKTKSNDIYIYCWQIEQWPIWSKNVIQLIKSDYYFAYGFAYSQISIING